MEKLYLCNRWPDLVLGRCQFKSGQFRTDNPELQAAIERNDQFGVHIFLAAGPAQAVLDEGPRVRQGARNSASLV